MTAFVCAALLLCVAAASHAAFTGARYSREAERLFTSGITAYDADDLTQARTDFDKIRRLPANQRSGASLLMLTRTLMRLGAQASTPAEASQLWSDAVDASRELTRKAPDSRYTADARLLAGDAYHQMKRYYEAATEYSRVLHGTAAIAVRASAAERLAAIVRNRAITTEAQDRLRMLLGEQRLRDALIFGEGRWYGRLGWASHSAERFRAYVDSIGPSGMFYSLVPVDGTSNLVPAEPVLDTDTPAPAQGTAQAGAWTPRSGREEVPRIGILAPLTGPRWERDIGRELVAGARMANEEMGEPFELVVVDTGSEQIVVVDGSPVPIYQNEASRLIRVVGGTRFLVDEVGVLAIIGPVFSTSAAAAAGVTEAAGVPLITPLAQQSGLDTLGTHLFQLNPVPETQGQALAEYATLVLGLETIAILSPISDYGLAFERAFVEAASNNGGQVVHSDWYYPQATDFKAQFTSLRSKGFRLMPSAGGDSLALFDSLETALLDTSVAGEWMFEVLIRAEGIDHAAAQPDSSELFVDTIDGMAIVVEHFDDAARIAPQLHFHRLQTAMLGNDVWNDAEALAELTRTERNHMRGATFVARRQGAAAERDFVDRYRVRTHRDDAGYAAAGYDAARLILNGWSDGRTTRAELRQYLADVRQFEGASGRVSFSANRRANSEMALLKIGEDGAIRTLQAQDLPDMTPAYVDTDLPAEDLPALDGAEAGWEAAP